jgi:Domain of unknown function (DUF5703)
MNTEQYTRRTFLKTAGLATGGLAVDGFAAEARRPEHSDKPAAATGVELRNVIARSDLHYIRPVARSEEGIPIGNGRMGTLVWTTPSQLRFQINRVDVYANNCETNSFFESHNDYCGGCAYLELEFGGNPFPEAGFRQNLSVYDGKLTVEGEEMTIQMVPWMAQDVIAITVDDRRKTRGPISAVLRMLRYETKYLGPQLETLIAEHAVTVRHFSQTATSRLLVEGERIALTQEFREDKFCSKSAVAVAIAGKAGQAEILNETDVRVLVQGGGPATILIASAASFQSGEDVAAIAYRQLDAAIAEGLPSLEQASQQWWHDFWSRGHIQLHSGDGTAEFVQENYHYFLYLMAATSRGKLPPKFNGMLWSTGGDLRMWGAQHWFANLSCYYEALPATGRFELMDPMYDMYSAMYDSCVRAARQQWGSEGLYIPETVYFDGLEELPVSIADEMRELYLLQKPWEQHSSEFMEYARSKHSQSSRWNWIVSGHWNQGRHEITERGSGPYGPTSHIFSSNAKIAYLYWQRYEFTLDREWLRDRAYPMLRGVVEFYRNHPNVKKGDDGKYHIHWANSGEPVFGARDTIEDLSSMRGVTSALLRASELLDIDRETRPVWREFLEHLAPLPTSDQPEALHPADYHGPRMFVSALKPAVKGDRSAGSWAPDGNSLPIWFFDFCHLGTRDSEALGLAQATFDHLAMSSLQPDAPVGGLSKLPIAAAYMGRADAVQTLLPKQMRAMPMSKSSKYKNGGRLDNRMSLLEGAQALDAEHLGRASEALHLALLQSNPPAPGEDPILHLFPAWPKQWDARFTLLARGGFRVTASIENGSVHLVEFQSMGGSLCRLRNPFPGAVDLYRNDKQAERLGGTLIEFKTEKGERITVKQVI